MATFKRAAKLLLALLLTLGAVSARAAHTQADLLLSDAAARPGDTVMAVVRLQMDPGWHTYWKNPGDSGMATKIVWELPTGVTAGDTLWPTPVKDTTEGLTTYVYKGETALVVPIKLSPDLKPGPLDLKAKVSWLECQEICVPGKADVEATLDVGTELKPSNDTPVVEAAQQKLPKPGDGLSPHAEWEKAATDDNRPLILQCSLASAPADVDFLPDASDDFEVEADTQVLSTGSPQVSLRKTVKKLSGDWPQTVSGLLVTQTGGEVQSFDVTFPISAGTAVPAITTNSPGATVTPASEAPTVSLWKMLAYAFIGGLILNIMPCVLPVIALKILGFVGQSREHPGRVRMLGLVYAAGVMVSFLVLAALVIGVKAAGHRASWGMQFSDPYFVVGMTVLVTLVALNLFGIFEVTMSSRVLGSAANLSSREGAGGAFFNGLLATILATPCTAPILASALGFAFKQSAGLITLFFLTIGAGLAAPYVVLSWQPEWLKFLPKPGVWMEKFKIAMGFPMLATAVWLLCLSFSYFDKRALWLGLLLVIVAMAAWIFGEFVQRGRNHKGFALIAALALLVGGSAFAFHKLNEPEVVWQPWSPEAVAKARSTGHPVLVDFTADWCVNCNALVKPVLESARVRTKLEEINAVKLLADDTHFPPEIADELAHYDRAGVPMVLVFPKNANEPATVLPAVITEAMVVNALEDAAK